MMTKLVVVAALLLIWLAPTDVPPQCDQQVFARSNPGLCYSGPLGQLPPTGGGRGDGGLLGTIGRVLHGLTGGLL